VLIQPSTFAVPYKFTGKERDPESGLDDFDARFYSSPFGRFMTPDWEAKPTDVPYANFGNPQSLNLYSYVQNNPTTVGDPDGHGDEAVLALPAASQVFGPEVGIPVLLLVASYEAYEHRAEIAQSVRSIRESIFHSEDSSKNTFFSSRDAEAGQLQAAGREATDKANATIERASNNLTGYKNPNDVSAHIDELKKGVDRVKGLSTQLDTTKGKAERDNIKSELKREIDQVKGHEKDLRQKPRKKKQS
jgi:RHS repeat-associated protein